MPAAAATALYPVLSNDELVARYTAASAAAVAARAAHPSNVTRTDAEHAAFMNGTRVKLNLAGHRAARRNRHNLPLD